ncbi:hypothetical protein [Chitinophaga eiseniae]|uniref:hypothetical protein n=1 Tax=Chitinophaga eiseniae TaxID=634771 RepID=UPI00099A3A13|nr:hypothetical protein [Chitinophaga eiseniae]
MVKDLVSSLKNSSAKKLEVIKIRLPLRSALIESTHTKALHILHFYTCRMNNVSLQMMDDSAFALALLRKEKIKNLEKRFGRNEKLLTFATPTITGQRTGSEVAKLK